MSRAAVDPSRAREIIVELSRHPRGAGGPEEERAREYCSRFLTAAGLTVHGESFNYSRFPGVWGTSLAGAALILAFIGSTVAAYGQRPLLGAIVLIFAICEVAVIVVLARPPFMLDSPVMRASATNLVALSDGSDPELWLVAHLDSKSQRVSILERALGVTVSALALAVVAALLLISLGGVVVSGTLWILIGGVGVIASLPILLSTVADKSNGALDNATGVAAVLLAAERLHSSGVRGFGVVITSAEELGLAGAHAFTRNRLASAGINCDSIDDAGGFLCIAGAQAGCKVHRGVSAAFAASETPLRSLRTLPGILVDAVAFQQKGWDMVTLCKGEWQTLRRIHTSEDGAELLTGVGAADCAAHLSDAVQRLQQPAGR